MGRIIKGAEPRLAGAFLALTLAVAPRFPALAAPAPSHQCRCVHRERAEHCRCGCCRARAGSHQAKPATRGQSQPERPADGCIDGTCGGENTPAAAQLPAPDGSPPEPDGLASGEPRSAERLVHARAPSDHPAAPEPPPPRAGSGGTAPSQPLVAASSR